MSHCMQTANRRNHSVRFYRIIYVTSLYYEMFLKIITSASASSRSLRLSESQLNVSCSCFVSGVIVVFPICIEDLRSENEHRDELMCN